MITRRCVTNECECVFFFADSLGPKSPKLPPKRQNLAKNTSKTTKLQAAVLKGLIELVVCVPNFGVYLPKTTWTFWSLEELVAVSLNHQTCVVPLA